MSWRERERERERRGNIGYQETREMGRPCCAQGIDRFEEFSVQQMKMFD